MDHGSRTSPLPVFLDLRGRLCAIVGGGAVAARRARAVLAAGARVRVIAPEVGREMQCLLGVRQVELVRREFRPGDLAGSALVFAAADSPGANAAVGREARSLAIPVNVADAPDLCDFTMPARLDRPPICIAVGTGGSSPALARRLRDRLAAVLTPQDQRLAELLGRLRPQAGEAIASSEERRRRWELVIDSDVSSLLRDGRDDEAEALARRLLGLGQGAGREETERRLTIGTRASPLAMAQARSVAARLAGCGVDAVLRPIRTAGDATPGPLDEDRGWFVGEIEEALRRGEVDLAVHSLKDLPTGSREGLVIAAIPERADPRDVLVTNSGSGLSELPAGSRVGASSARRTAQLRAHRPDLAFAPVRGNVDTRLRKLRRGDYDALVLARAGLLRLGLTGVACETLSTEVCLPAPAQGALAIQARDDDRELRDLVSPLDHAPTRLAVEAERAFLARLGAGCGQAAAALAVVEGERLTLQVAVPEPDGGPMVRRSAECPAGEGRRLGRALAEEMLDERTTAG